VLFVRVSDARLPHRLQAIECAVCSAHPAGTANGWAKKETLVARATSMCLAMLGVAGLLLAGCTEGNNLGGDPGAVPLAFGQSCGSLQQEMNRLLGKGVQGSVEREASGKPVAPAAKADVDRYNALLSQYLGARCHA
jgi:hypothetical protein